MSQGNGEDLRFPVEDYVAALRAYLEGEGEHALARAFAIGRDSVSRGHGAIDLAQLHAQALAQTLPGFEGTRACADMARQSCDVLAEGLASVEMMFLGFRESNESLRRVNEALEARVAERTQDLEHAQRRYLEIIESTPAVLYARRLSAPADFVYMSPRLEALLGYRAEEWTVQRAHDSVHEEDRELYADALARCQADGDPLAVEYRLYDKAGELRHVSDQGHIVAGGDGEALLHGIITDVTPQVELQRQLVQAQKMEAVGRLAGGVAHDFNNLLTVILSFTRFVLDDLAEDDVRGDDLREVLRAADSAAVLTSQLLAFSRQRAAEARVIDPNEVVTRIDKMTRRTLPEGVDMSTILGDDMWSVLIDPGQLEQVILNLVVNAQDAMPAGGTLSLKTRKEPSRVAAGNRPRDWVELSVSDTGEGMTEEVRSRVFEPFFTTKGTHGTGLGLSTCFGIVRQAGGFIEVDSAPGQGTEVRVILPRAEGLPAHTREADEQERPEGSARVLVVEDQPALRRMVARVLGRAGYSVHEAITAEEALELVEGGLGIDLLLTDLALPGMTGQRLATTLRRQRPELPVLITSGYVEDDRLMTSDAFLAKPFTGAQLLRSVKSVLEAARVSEES